ncbi:hypothetical protein F441_02361 [Phytophthora nicotianae CJ01A1]|uniref:FAR1 domain-containing protein n=1 Tax=Phytophthora nicotianae CJ01A1 TaxID=1317063 RepID=W2XQB1_PHYNI|nr:hypothetical protein F441_02361 [Phytophthora nicotianae CJ01A1]
MCIRSDQSLSHCNLKGRHFKVSRQKVEGNKNGDIRTRLFACDRSGKPKNTRHLREEDRVRTMRGSKRIGCPMRIKIVAVDENNTEGPWKLHTPAMEALSTIIQRL